MCVLKLEVNSRKAGCGRVCLSPYLLAWARFTITLTYASNFVSKCTEVTVPKSLDSRNLSTSLALIIRFRRVMISCDMTLTFLARSKPLVYKLLIMFSTNLTPYTLRSFNFSSASLGEVPAGTTFGLGALSTLPFAFWEVVSLGRSLVNGMKSGAPGRYFRSGSGTVKPCPCVSH